jgi:hypothetical protein
VDLIVAVASEVLVEEEAVDMVQQVVAATHPGLTVVRLPQEHTVRAALIQEVAEAVGAIIRQDMQVVPAS